MHKCGSVVYNHYTHKYAVRYASAARRSSTRANAIQIAGEKHKCHLVVSCLSTLKAMRRHVLQAQQQHQQQLHSYDHPLNWLTTPCAAACVQNTQHTCPRLQLYHVPSVCQLF